MFHSPDSCTLICKQKKASPHWKYTPKQMMKNSEKYVHHNVSHIIVQIGELYLDKRQVSLIQEIGIIGRHIDILIW